MAPRSGPFGERVARELRGLPAGERRQALTQLASLVRELGGPELLGAELHSAAASDGTSSSSLPSSSSGLSLSGPRRVLLGAVLVVLLFVLVPNLQVADPQCSTRNGAGALLPSYRPARPVAIDAVPVSCPEAAPCSCPSAIPCTCPKLPLGANGFASATRGGNALSWSSDGGGAGGVSSSMRLAGRQGYPRPSGEYPRHDAFSHPREALTRLRAQVSGGNTSDFPLLLCVGQGKTATKSLNKALVMLGFRTAHFYGAGVYGLLYDNAAEATNHQFLFNVNEEKHVDAVLDTPVVDFYNEILLAYPNARVVLTVRGVRSWLKSQQKFYCCYARGCRRWLAPWRRGSNLVYGTECPSKEQAVKRYVQHNRNVFDNVHPDRLLVMDIPGGDGWEKLIPFLNSFLPQRVEMPSANLTFPSRH